MELFEGVKTYIDYYNQKRQQGTGMIPNQAYNKLFTKNVA